MSTILISFIRPLQLLPYLPPTHTPSHSHDPYNYKRAHTHTHSPWSHVSSVSMHLGLTTWH